MRLAFLLLLFCVGFLPTASPAMIVTGPASEPLTVLRLSSHRVEARIDGLVARTRITQVWTSIAPGQLEAFFVVPTPRDSQVTEFSITIDGQKLTSEVMDAGDARRIYEAIVRRMRDPGLLEYIDARTLRLRVFPIPPRGEAILELEYLETLRREGELAAYRFQAPSSTHRPAPGQASIVVHVNSPQPLGTIFTPSAGTTIQRDAAGTGATVTLSSQSDIHERFVLYFSPGKDTVGLSAILDKDPGADSGTAMFVLTPPPPVAEYAPLAKDVLFVFDTSGSMSDAGKMDKMIASLQQCLGGLNAADRFALIQFSTGMAAFRDGFSVADATSVAAAREWLAGQRARGGTNIAGALELAARMLAELPTDEARVRQVIFMTDGLPTVGATDDVQIMAALAPAGGARPRVFTMGFGHDVNTHLLDAIAEQSGAVSSYVDPAQDIELAVDAVFQAISRPAMTNLRLEATGFTLEDQYPIALPDLFYGRHLLVLARYRGTGTGTVTLRGRSGTSEVTETLKLAFPDTANPGGAPIRAIWAQRRVGFLLDQVRRNGESKELREEIVALATEHGLVTPYTSFLAAPDAEYANLGTAPVTASRPRVQMHEASAAPARRDAFARSGAASVQMAEEMQSLKRAEAVSAFDAREVLRRDGTATIHAGRRAFERAANTTLWIERGLSGATPVAVKYLSPAYYELLARFPQDRGAILVGEQVRLSLGGVVVEIGENGAEATLPEALRDIRPTS